MANSQLNSALDLAERVGDLVRIPSVNPLQGGPKANDDGEQALSDWMANRCQEMGASVITDEVFPNRNNVYARFDGNSDKTITVDVHLDTVGVEHMTDDPFDGRIEGTKVFGRGSVDTKASLAIVLAVIEEIQRGGDQLTPTVNVVGTISEEAGGLVGAIRYNDWLLERGDRVDRMIVAEPTVCRPVHGHKGGGGLEITVHGHAAHSSKPHLGVNAISGAARIVAAIDAENARLGSLTPPTPVGNGTVAVLEIEGGVARNIIAPSCSMYCGRRIAPGEDPQRVHDDLVGLVREAAAPCEIDTNVPYGFFAGGFWQDPDSEIVRQLSEYANSEPDIASYGTNALRYDPVVADQMVVFGPGSIDQAHQAVEWVEIAELERCANVYRQLLRG